MQISTEAALSFMSSNYQIASLVLVYHLFAIQHWLTRLEDLCDNALATALDSGAQGVSARYHRNRCARQFNNYPWLDVVVLLALLVGLALHSAVTSGHLGGAAPPTMALAPLGVLMAAYVVGSGLAWRRGRAKLAEVNAALADNGTA